MCVLKYFIEKEDCNFDKFGQAWGMALKCYSDVAKWLKQKVTIFGLLTPTFGEDERQKLEEGAFLLPALWIGLNLWMLDKFTIQSKKQISKNKTF